MAKLAFLGMGVMGGPMAGHLAAAGHDLTVWNRTPEKCKQAVDRGAKQATSLAEAVAGVDGVFLCVSRSEDVLDCLQQAIAHASTGTLFIDHSTISDEAARQAAHLLADHKMRFLDAPITGGSMGAQAGKLTIFVGGASSDFEVAKEWMLPYTKRCELVGGHGQGQVTKMANQIAVAGALIGLCESLAFAQRAGLDLALTRELLSGGAAGSWAFENYGPKILNQDWTPGFSIDNQQKDLEYCLAAAAKNGQDLPLTELVHELLAKLQNQNRGADTTAALFDVLT